MSKKVSISARISQEDAEYLNRLKIEGAKTPSDKLRALLADARQRDVGAQDYQSCLHGSQAQINPLLERVQQAEFESGVHSELVIRLMQWLPDATAYVTATLPESRTEDGIHEHELCAFERGCADRIFRLMESILQLGITQRGPCYDPSVINEHIKPVLELADVIARSRMS